MKRLILMRHGQSPVDGPFDDRERPLDATGRSQAVWTAQGLTQKDWTPQQVLCSDATRTQQTWEAMVPHLPQPDAVTHLASLYLANLGALVAAVLAQPTDATTLLALGHNPGWSEAVGWLSAERANLSPASAALLQHEADTWEDALLSSTSWVCIDLLRPPGP